MKYGVFQLKRRSRSVESFSCIARSSASRFFCDADAGFVVSPRATRIESSILQIARTPRGLHDRLARARAVVEPPNVAALRFGVDDVRIGRILRRVEAVAAADGEPVAVGDRAAALAARPAPAAVVLQPAAHAVRHRHVVADLVELPDRDAIEEVVVAAAVPRLRDAAVVADDEVLADRSDRSTSRGDRRECRRCRCAPSCRRHRRS